MDLDINTLSQVTLLCFILHNYCEIKNERLPEQNILWSLNYEKTTQPPKSNLNFKESIHENAAKSIRKALGKFPPANSPQWIPPGQFPPGEFPPYQIPIRWIPTRWIPRPSKFPPGDFPPGERHPRKFLPDEKMERNYKLGVFLIFGGVVLIFANYPL